jgi:hypothetical protein
MQHKQRPMISTRFASTTAAMAAALSFMAGFALSEVRASYALSEACTGMMFDGICLQTATTQKRIHVAPVIRSAEDLDRLASAYAP